MASVLFRKCLTPSGSRVRSHRRACTGFRGTSFRGTAGIGRAGVAHFEADEPRDGDVLLQARDPGLDELVDCHRVVLDEWLVHQADFFVELLDAPLDDAIQNLLRLALCAGTIARDLFLFFEYVGGNLFTSDPTRVGG